MSLALEGLGSILVQGIGPSGVSTAHVECVCVGGGGGGALARESARAYVCE